jgi:hypothetical protein
MPEGSGKARLSSRAKLCRNGEKFGLRLRARHPVTTLRFLIRAPLFTSIVLMFRLSAAARIALVCMDWLASGQSGESLTLADPA